MAAQGERIGDTQPQYHYTLKCFLIVQKELQLLEFKLYFQQLNVNVSLN